MATSSTFRGWKLDTHNSRLNIVYDGTTVGYVDANGIHGDEITIQSGIVDATYDTDRFIWTAPWACTVTKVEGIASAIESSSATTTLMIEKVPSGTAIASGTDILAAALNLKTGVTANTKVAPALHATAANLALDAGDSLALDFTNALTEFVGCFTVTVERT